MFGRGTVALLEFSDPRGQSGVRVRYDVSADSDGTVTISRAAQVGIYAEPAPEAALAPTIAGRPTWIVVYASALEFADSSAIALFARWANLARHLEVRDPTPALHSLIPG